MAFLSRVFWNDETQINPKDGNSVYLPVPTIDQKLVIKIANSIFEKQYFSICDLDDIKDTFNIIFTRPDLYNRLRILHCKSYKRMDAEIYDFVVASVKELLRTAVKWNDHQKPFFTFEDFTQNDPNVDR